MTDLQSHDRLAVHLFKVATVAILALYTRPEFRCYTRAMQNLKTVSNSVLLANTQALVRKEREVTTQILWHMHEIQRRRLFAEQGYSSLFQYALSELGYSESAAARRIAAMRLLIEIPEIESEVESGRLSLSTLCSTQHFFQRQEMPLTRERKKEIALSLRGKSRRECDKAFAAIGPQTPLRLEQERVVSATHTEIRFTADEELMLKLKAIRDIDSHVLGAASYFELFHRMADLALKKLDPHHVKRAPFNLPRAV